MQKVLIAGVGMTPFTKTPGRGVRRLATAAAAEALEVSGVPVADIEMIYLGNAVAGVVSQQEMIRGQVAFRESRHHENDTVFVADAGSSDRAERRVVDLIGKDDGDAAGRCAVSVDDLHLRPVCELRDEAGARDRVLRANGDGDALNIRDGNHGTDVDIPTLTGNQRPLNGQRRLPDQAVPWSRRAHRAPRGRRHTVAEPAARRRHPRCAPSPQ